jgi:hypothetical protein
MTFQEINAALAASNTSDIEDAFKALVEYPGHGGRIPGATRANLRHALDRVCDALLEDHRIMPGGTFDAIKGNLPDETALAGATYSHGAMVVKQNAARWNTIFAMGA